MRCLSCGKNEFQQNQFGENVCINCSHVQDLQRFDNDVAFNEQQGILGQRVDIFQQDQGRGSLNLFFHTLDHRGYISTFDKDAERTLSMLKKDLEVQDEYFEAFDIARNLLKIAYQNMNEKWQYVHIYAGAAVYFGFRSKQAPYLLIDIAEKLEKCNVIRLARCYLKLLNYVRSDCLTGEIVTHQQNLQFIDPSIYIPRFVRALEFKEKQGVIIETAKKLVKRMMLDWMSYGRRPSSLCGAAMLISARFHGENITTTEVCKVVFVCDETIRKRLAEFNRTPLAQLTVEQFDQIKDIENDVPGGFMNPPAYTRAREKEALQLKHEQMINNTNTEESEKELYRCTMKEAIVLELIKSKSKEEEVKLKSLIKSEQLSQEDLADLLKDQKQTIQTQSQQFDRELSQLLQSEQSEPLGKVEDKMEDKMEENEVVLSDLEESEINDFILSRPESDQKQKLWTNLYSEWIRDKQKEKEKGKLNQVEKKKRKKREITPLVNAPDPQTAILEHSKFGNQVNKQALGEMFNTIFSKKVKVELNLPLLDSETFFKELQDMLKEEADQEETSSRRGRHTVKQISQKEPL